MRVCSRKNFSDTGKVADALEKAIRSGSMKSGERLARIRDLTAHFNVGMTAVMRALDKLEQKQLIVRHPRSGVFVADLWKKPSRKILLISAPGTLSKADAPGSYFIPCFEKECRQRNWLLDIVDISFINSLVYEQAVDALKNKQYDGCVLCGSGFTGMEDILPIVKKLDIPVILPCAQPGDSDITGFPSLVYAPEICWQHALQYLIDSGFRAIGAIGNSHSNHRAISLRASQSSHIEFLKKNHLTLPEQPVCYIDWNNPAEAQELLSLFLENYHRFDALLCYSDFHAALVYDYCRKHAIRIPEDLAVMGIGCYTGWELLSPRLTTLDFHYDRNAEKTAEWLENMPESGFSELWKPEIMPGESTEKRDSTKSLRKGIFL